MCENKRGGIKNMHSYSMDLGGRTLTIEAGKIAKQANGAVLVRYGDTAVVVFVLRLFM